MSQSLSRNYIHIVFSTKKRQALILPSIASELYSYLASICNKLECYCLITGGHKDHVHILCLLSKKMTLSSLLEELKSSSSKWIKGKDPRLKDFYWQRGYGAFSVNPSQLDVVKQYIENQQKHHERRTFQEEYITTLKKYNIEYDERYVWD
jgi:putative transposase